MVTARTSILSTIITRHQSIQSLILLAAACETHTVTGRRRGSQSVPATRCKAPGGKGLRSSRYLPGSGYEARNVQEPGLQAHFY